MTTETPGQTPPPVGTVVKDPNFLNLSYEERAKVLMHLDPHFATLGPDEQRKAVMGMDRFKQSASYHPDQPEHEAKGVVRSVGLLGTGINKGLADFVGMPVDLLNAGLTYLGLPMSDKPVMGSDMLKSTVMKPFITEHADTATERVIERTGEEIGASLLPIGASLKLAQAGVNAPRFLQHLVEDLARIDPGKLALAETGIAASAGAGAGAAREVVRETWPDGGPIADFLGELIGGFGATGTLALLKKAKELPGMAARFLGYRTEQEVKEEVSGKLDSLVDPERLDTGMEKTAEIQKDIPGFNPTLGQTEGNPGIIAAERGFERKQGSGGVRKFEERRQENQSAVNKAVGDVAPEGEPGDVRKGVQRGTQKEETLLDKGLGRAQTMKDLAEKKVNAVTAQVLQDAEEKMTHADQRATARLNALRGTLTDAQAGRIIREEYQAELDSARVAKDELYDAIDPMRVVRLPVKGLKADVQRLVADFDPRVENAARIPDELIQRIKSLGVDHELQMRAEKAMDDLDAVGGKTKDQRGGFTIPLEQQGKGSTAETVGVPSNYPYWYKSIANEKIAGTDNVLDRETIEKALDTIRNGRSHGLHEKTIDHVAKALNADSEFRGSPWHEDSMWAYSGEQTESLDTIKRLRSEILTQIRETAPQNRPLRMRLNKLLDATERTIGQLDDNVSLTEAFPDASERFREANRNYAVMAQRLLAGKAEQLSRRDAYGRYRTIDEDAAEKFTKGETSMNDFVAALGDHPRAVEALRQSLRADFWKSAVPAESELIAHKPKVSVGAAANWIRTHDAALRQFPELGEEFGSVASLQRTADQMAKDYASVSKNTTLAAKLADPQAFLQLDAAEQRLLKVKATVERTRRQSDKDVASGFLGREVPRVAEDIVRSRNPDAEVKSVLKRLRGDEVATRGFTRAMWDAALSRFSSQATEMFTGTPILQARRMREFLDENKTWMTPLFGKERMARLSAARDAMEMIERTGRVPAPGGSDTALTLETAAKDFGPMWSKVIGVAQGRMGKHWVWLSQVSNRISKHFANLTEGQRSALFEEAFFDPKVAQTLILAERGAASESLIKARVRAHLLNMNHLHAEDDE